MIGEADEAREYLINKFGSAEKVPPGTYAVPTEIFEGAVFMRVVVDGYLRMSDFHLFWDEELSYSFNGPKPAAQETTEDLKIKCMASLIALYAEVPDSVADDVKNNVKNYTKALRKNINDLKKYVKHLPECNIMQDWYEADDAMSRIPESMRDDGYYKAQEEIDKKKRTCTCGLEELLNS